MSKDVIRALEAEIERAVADGDEEIADILRERLEAIREGRPTGSMLRRLQPGELGQNTDGLGRTPPKDWVKPERPDPMTRVHKPGSRRSD